MKVDLVTPEQARQLLQSASTPVVLSDATDACTLVLLNGASARGVLQLEALAFDSKLFGVPMARLTLIEAEDPSGYAALLAGCEAECLRRGVRHVVRRLGVGAFHETWALESAGYRMVDVSVLFERSVDPSPHEVDAAIRPLEPDEIERLADQYAEAFSLTRFAVDPFFSRAGAAELHRQWISNSCRGRADMVLVCAKAGELQGFVTCRVDAATRTGGIELIAVDAARRGAGTGRQLVAGALAWFRGRVDCVQVRTQLNNTGACTLYQASGFRLKLGELTYSRTFAEEKLIE